MTLREKKPLTQQMPATTPAESVSNIHAYLTLSVMCWELEMLGGVCFIPNTLCVVASLHNWHSCPDPHQLRVQPTVLCQAGITCLDAAREIPDTTIYAASIPAAWSNTKRGELALRPER